MLAGLVSSGSSEGESLHTCLLPPGASQSLVLLALPLYHSHQCLRCDMALSWVSVSLRTDLPLPVRTDLGLSPDLTFAPLSFRNRLLTLLHKILQPELPNHYADVMYLSRDTLMLLS